MIFNKEKIDNLKKSGSKRRDVIPKILSVFAAVILWFYVIDVQTTIEEKVISGVPVVIQNFDNSDNLDIVSGKEHTIEVTVSGVKNDISQISQKDIIATADMNGVESAGNYKLDIDIVTPSGVAVINKSSSEISVTVDKTTTKNREVEVKLLYSTDADVYEIGEPILSLSSVQIKGPEKIVDSVEKLEAKLDLGNVKNTVKAECSLVPVDKDGNVVSSPYLKLSNSTVSVRVPVYKTVAVNIVPVFVSNDRYSFEYDLSYDKIKIKGEVSDIESIDVVNTEVIVSTKPSHIVKQLDLPDDVSAFTMNGTPISSIDIHVTKVIEHSLNDGVDIQNEQVGANA